MKYQVFTNDADANLYSAFSSLDANTEAEAQVKAKAQTLGLQNMNGRAVRVLVVPETLVDEAFIETPRGLKLRKRT